MTEYLPLLGGERKPSRRDLLVAAGLAIAAMTGDRLTKGVRLDPPPLFLDDRQINEIEWLADVGEATLFKSEGKLLFDPTGDFFTTHNTFKYVHRGGNSSKEIQASAQMGANLFDVDANNAQGVLLGDIYAEHGIVPGLEIDLGKLSLKFHLPIIVDVDEMELKLGRPENTYAETIEQISLFSNERLMAVSTELKRGEFDRDTLIEVFDIHQTYNVPAMFHSPNSEYLSNVGDEIAAYYNSMM